MTSPLASRGFCDSISNAGALRAPLVRVSTPERQESKMPMRTDAAVPAMRAFSCSSGSAVSPRRRAPSLAWPEK